MKTSADNRRVRQILTGVKNGTIIPRPEFQRNLVWSNKDKLAFLDTVLRGYPFPEIYVALTEVDLETAEGAEMLVDGQQRVTTLYQYFTGSDALKLSANIPPYRELLTDAQTDFMNYEVAVRNLGVVSIDIVKEIFKRINATSYALNAMEINNARYNGALKIAADKIASDQIFNAHRTFSQRELQRMRNTVYALTIIITMISTYFHRDDEIENYLDMYNDEFPMFDDVIARFSNVREFIESLNLTDKSRAWKKTDLLVLIIELDRALNREKIDLDPDVVGPALESFYNRVDAELSEPSGDEDLQAYFRTTVQATNDRASRSARGRVVRKVLLATVGLVDQTTAKPEQYLLREE